MRKKISPTCSVTKKDVVLKMSHVGRFAFLSAHTVLYVYNHVIY